MNADDQRQLVLDYLARREQIAAETRDLLAEREAAVSVDPLAQVDPTLRESAEDEFFASRGRHRYKTSDGRTLFLTPEEIAQRRRARAHRTKSKGRFYGPSGDDQRRKWVGYAFNLGAVVLALVVVFLIMH
jgi:hypothetical protein